MKNFKKPLILIFLSLVLVGSPASAAKLLKKDNQGVLHFKCDRTGFVGRARVKLKAPGEYQVFGPYRSGVLSANSPYEAAKESCGENRGVKL